MFRMKTPVRDQVNRMKTVEYFTLLAQLMKTNPPASEDAPALARFARIGLVAGQDFDASKLNAIFAKRIPEIGFDRILAQYKINKEVKDINGWGFTTKTGLYGTDYRMRALITAAAPQAQSRWLGRSLHPGCIARREQGVELASGPNRQIHPDVAHVLAQRNPSINPRRFMETSGGGKAIGLRHRRAGVMRAFSSSKILMLACVAQ